MSLRLLAIAAAVAFPAAASATTITTVTFDDLDSSPDQTFLNSAPDLLTVGDFTFDVSLEDSTGRGIALFNTRCVLDGLDCNGDEDLVPDTQGDDGVIDNVLIIQEPGAADIPDDDFRGGTIRLTLSSGPSLNFTGLSVIDDALFTFGVGIGGVDTVLGSINMNNPSFDGDTASASFFSDTLSVGDSIFLTTNGSGAFDSLVLSAPAPVPVPAALPLLMGGLIGLGLYGRRRKAS